MDSITSNAGAGGGSSCEFSIIIPVRDSPQLLERLLDSISMHAPADVSREVIVVDDGSRDSLGPLCTRLGARMLRNETSQGPAAARNSGAAAANGSLLFFMDADAIYAPGLIEKACTLLREDPELQGVSFYSHRYDEKDGVVRNFGAAIEHYWFQQLAGPGVEAGALNGFTTRNGVIRREAFSALNGFDTTYKTNAIEDYEFGKRLAAKFKCVIAREPIVYHSFPDRFARLLRNYFVRASLFVRYVLRNRSQLDKAQTSGAEAMIRCVGVAAIFFLLLALLPVPAKPAWAVAACACVLGYLFAIVDFLRAALRWSNSFGFAAACFAIHFATSPVIVAGGVHGLLLSTRGRPKGGAE